MPTELVTVNLTRESENELWGFELAGGGRDKNVRLYISEVKPGSIAEKVGLKVKDSLVKIGHDCALDYTIEEATESLKKGKDFFDMIVERECVGRKISYEKSATGFNVKLGTRATQVIQEFDAFTSNVDVDPSREYSDVVLQREIIEDPRYLGLKKEDRQKVGFHDVSKPTLRKDWNCPWIRRDGKGIKKVLRTIDPVPAPTRTSLNHFYSEPGSILAPEAPPMAPEQLERMIQERMGLVQKEEQKSYQRMEVESHEMHEERFEQNKMEVEFSHQQQHQDHFQSEPSVEQGADVDEEDSCPPDLEAVEVEQVQQEYHQQQVQQQPRAQEPVLLQPGSDLIRNLAIAIRAGMEAYQGSGSYEPSADELIDVLKNLENLAAVNPALYKAIVDQIKVCHSSNLGEEQIGGHQAYSNHQQNGHENGHMDDDEMSYQQGYSEVDQQQFEEDNAQCIQEFDQEPMHETCLEESETDRAAVEQKTPEQLKLEQREARIKAEVEREHEEQMRQLKEKKRKEKEPPPPPKTITVMAGSRNRPSWPIAPGIANANIPREIVLTSGETSQDQEELMKARFEVAQAAGLKHVDIIHGDENFYPTPLKDYDYPWAGSLKPVSSKLVRGSRGARGQDMDNGSSPWAGSLRHVDENKMRRKKQKEADEDDLYGTAPWMGTLRHVKHENKVTAALKPQFKRYPDEDAPNPFEGMGGRDAKPVYPLTPAAVIPKGGSSKEGRERAKQEAEVDRITAGLRETRTVSSALLNALLPKLLKEHESKYEPLGQDESFKIMEEILAMQIGINSDGKVEDNDEAEQIIRAITHGEIDNNVYSQMADDLENAAQLKRKEKAKKKKKKKVTSGKNTAELKSSSEVDASASEA